MDFATFFSNQARKPTGLFGRFVAAQIFKKGKAKTLYGALGSS